MMVEKVFPLLAAFVLFGAPVHGSSSLVRQPNASDAPSISFGVTDFDLSGVGPRATVAIFGVGLTPLGYDSTVSRWSTVVRDTTGGGQVHFDAGQRIPWKSIWVAVELPTLKYCITAPSGYGIHSGSRSRRSLKRGPASHIDTLAFAASAIDVLYVAPDGNCWSIGAADGYETDADTVVDGMTSVNLQRFRSLTGVPPPSDFSPGGLLFVIDFLHMEVTALPVNADLLDGAQ